MEVTNVLDTPPISPSQEKLRGIVDQIRIIYTNPSQAWMGHFLKSWKIHYNGVLGRYDTLTVSTPDSNPPLHSPEEKSVRITLSGRKGYGSEKLHFKLEQDTYGKLKIHQEGFKVEKGREVADHLRELPTDDIQSVKGVVDESNKGLEAKREWERGSGQAFVNSEEALELSKILSGKKVPYEAKGIFIGQRFIGIK